MTLTAKEIAGALITEKFSQEDLKLILIGYKEAVHRSRAITKLQFRVGDSVSFTVKDGRKFFGKITKINPQPIVVKTPTNNWKVSPNLLKKETA